MKHIILLLTICMAYNLNSMAQTLSANDSIQAELKARIKALLRRSGHRERSESNTLSIGSIRLDLNGRNAYAGNRLVELTAKEFDVVEFLMRNPNRVYSRENLLDTIWSYEYRSDIRTVDVHIRRLREKLEENPAEPKHIMTKWGVGYYFKK